KEGKTRRNEKTLLADTRPKHRWEPGYALDEIVRGLGQILQVISVDCLAAFARERPEFDSSARAKAEAIIHQFLNDLLVESARQFAAEKQNELAASEQNGQSILDSALDCIVVIDNDGCIQEWNIAAERLFGYSRAQAVGKEMAELIIPPELRARHRAGMAQFRATGAGPLLGRRIEVPALRVDGTKLDVELAITPYQVNGKAIFTAYVRDIDEFESETRRRVFSSGEGLPGRVFVSRAPTWLPNLEAETNFPRALFARMSGLQAAFVFPLMGSTGINGVIELYSDEVVPPD